MCSNSYQVSFPLWFPYKENTQVLVCFKVYLKLVGAMMWVFYRGPAMEWYEALHPYLLFSAKIRRWFMETVFCQHKERFSEFLLECPSTEVCL